MLAGRADLPIMAMTEVRASEIPLANIHAKPSDGVMKLLAEILKTFNRQTEWMVSLGRKSAIERVGSLFTELHDRLAEVGLAVGGRCTIPLTQQDIADTVGLTAVHVNRVLGDLRERDLVQFSGKTLRLLRPEAVGVKAVLNGGGGTDRAAVQLGGELA